MNKLMLIALFLIGCRTLSPTKTYSTVIDIEQAGIMCWYYFDNRERVEDSCDRYAIGDVKVFYKTK